MNVVDLASTPALTIPHFSPHRYPVRSVEGDVDWHQDEGGLHLRRRSDSGAGLASVYRLDVEDVRDRRLAVTGELTPGSITIDGEPFATIGEALAAAQPGTTIELGAGRHAATESYPLRVPAAVAVVGRGEVVVDGGGLPFGTPAFELSGEGASVEGITIIGIAEPYFLLAAPAVVISASGAAVRNCTVDGAVVVYGGADVEVAWNEVRRGNIASLGGERVRFTGNRQSGLRWGAGVDIADGQGHRVDANVIDGDLCGVRIRRATDVRVTGNLCTTRWWGIEIDGVVDGEVTGNRIVRAMRAVNVNKGAGNRVVANVAERCDTGVLVEQGAEGTEISANRLDRCRVAVLLWSSPTTEQRDNSITGSRHHDLVAGP